MSTKDFVISLLIGAFVMWLPMQLYVSKQAKEIKQIKHYLYCEQLETERWKNEYKFRGYELEASENKRAFAEKVNSTTVRRLLNGLNDWEIRSKVEKDYIRVLEDILESEGLMTWGRTT